MTTKSPRRRQTVPEPTERPLSEALAEMAEAPGTDPRVAAWLKKLLGASADGVQPAEVVQKSARK